jgi:hypothetical protein
VLRDPTRASTVWCPTLVLVTMVRQKKSPAVQVVWHPGGELLASASYDDTIKLWANDGEEWVCVQTLGGREGHCGEFQSWPNSKISHIPYYSVSGQYYLQKKVLGRFLGGGKGNLAEVDHNLQYWEGGVYPHALEPGLVETGSVFLEKRETLTFL